MGKIYNKGVRHQQADDPLNPRCRFIARISLVSHTHTFAVSSGRGVSKRVVAVSSQPHASRQCNALAGGFKGGWLQDGQKPTASPSIRNLAPPFVIARLFLVKKFIYRFKHRFKSIQSFFREYITISSLFSQSICRSVMIISVNLETFIYLKHNAVNIIV